jgi:hypothetical protein
MKPDVLSVPEFSIYINREHLGLAQLATEEVELFGKRNLCEKGNIFSNGSTEMKVL